MNYKIIILSFFFLTSFNSTFAQVCGINYSYDAAGNRIKRFLCTGTASSINSDNEVDELSLDRSEMTDQKQVEIIPEILVYPNPSTGVFFVKNLSDNTRYYQVYDQLGKVVISKQQFEEEIDLTQFANGQYYLMIYDGTRISRTQVLIFQ